MIRNLCLLFTILVPVLGNAQPLRVFVSVPPQKTFVEKVGGSHVEVRAMVRPGHSPATYSPTPQQISALAQSALYVRIGVPFEQAWMGRVQAANPAMQVLDARAGIDLRPTEHHGHGHGHEPAPIAQSQEKEHEEGSREQAELDPHIWTDPLLVKRIAANVRDALSTMDPIHSRDYTRGYEVFAAELDRLDREIRTLLKGLPQRKFMVFHPSWGYFADQYGLIQVPIEKEGKEPGARALSVLIEQAKRERVQVLFVQPQFDRRTARQIARAIGGRVMVIDPLSTDYINNLRRVAQQIAEAARP